MPRIPLSGGAYTAAGIIANAQRSFNLYQERNVAEDTPPVPVTHYPCPGLVVLNSPVGNKWRGLYQATNGAAYGVLDSFLYSIAPDWSLTQIGNVGNASTPISMCDNGIDLVVVTGPKGFTCNLLSQAFAQIVDPAFLGSIRVDYLDTFFVFNRPDTKQFFSSLSNSTTFDPLYVASKTSSPDLLQSFLIIKREIHLIGKETGEIWYNTGGPSFPFEILPGSTYEQGTAAKYSLADHDLNGFFLGHNKDGEAIAIMLDNYKAVRISTPAIEAEWAKYSDISDAIGMTYQQRGHVFYFLTFPTADRTWVFDRTSGLWHERGWIDANGVQHRHRANCIAQLFGQIVVGDWENGKLYKFSLDTFLDFSGPMSFIRGFPHLLNDGMRQVYHAFAADIECGNPVDTDQGTQIFLRWSDDRGKSFGNAVAQSFGASGKYLTQPQWQRLGLARDRVFELFWSTNVKTSLNGAWATFTPEKG